eukprot:TRINITY_DN3379_c0_g1_i1.p1 TRINITY_DN3379_c0_g1~~TRINITY_DN3379_c0_g1_i1.p1  ORF type:complete len:283 (-),score=32.35 TRINITY_DN3379_c0_g1_i1:204-1052(-)
MSSSTSFSSSSKSLRLIHPPNCKNYSSSSNNRSNCACNSRSSIRKSSISYTNRQAGFNSNHINRPSDTSRCRIATEQSATAGIPDGEPQLDEDGAVQGTTATGFGLGAHGPCVLLRFYKAWDPYGALSNFSPHPIQLPRPSVDGESETVLVTWPSVEHYYQAQKFAHSAKDDEVARAAIESILVAQSPEEAAGIGRRLERARPDLVTPDWPVKKLEVMEVALRAKFTFHASMRALLLSTQNATLVEASPHDFFWGSGRTGGGKNHLGRLLMKIRDELASCKA